MNLTDKVLAKLKEQYDFIIGNIAVVYKDLDWVLDSNVALRRQVEKHGKKFIGCGDETCCPFNSVECSMCEVEYPCTFSTEVANDLGIEVGEVNCNSRMTYKFINHGHAETYGNGGKQAGHHIGVPQITTSPLDQLAQAILDGRVYLEVAHIMDDVVHSWKIHIEEGDGA